MERMWGGHLVLVCVVAIALQVPSAFAPAAPAQMTDPAVVVYGSTACYLSGQPCTFTVSVSDPSLIFFRWDLNDDGTYDYPGWVGNNWTTDNSITIDPSSRYYDPTIPRVCAQAWDGVSMDNATHLPVGPSSCSDPSVVILVSLTVEPRQWSRHSMGQSVTADLILPAGVDPNRLVAGTLTLAGIPATPFRGDWHKLGGGGSEWKFKVDRTALTEKLGPGTHQVRFVATHEMGTLTAVDEVTIL